MNLVRGENRISIVLIDDDVEIIRLVTKTLQRDDIEILSTTSPQEGLSMVRNHHPPIVILDLTMPEMTGMEVLQEILHFDPKIEVVILTGSYSTESAVLAIQKGAAEYWTKPFSVKTLREKVNRLIAEIQRRHLQTTLDQETLANFEFDGIVGRSPLILEMLTRVRRIAPHFRTVLITGASGTGKELVARTIHRLSPVGDRPMVVCNCAAIVESLFESEMFGHMRGAFTGAHADKAGMFEMADKSSIFLDEVGELSTAAQAKLLRVLQNQETQRVGSGQARKVEVRVIAATNRDLSELVEKNQFRSDLYFRLAIVEIRVPSLLDRKEDLPLLQRHFVNKYAAAYGRGIRGLTRRAQITLATHSWPGNVRELESAIAHGSMVAEGCYIDLDHLPDYLRQQQQKPARTHSELVSMDEMQKRHARRILEQVSGNKVRAAQILDISRATLYRLLHSQRDQ